MKRIKILLFCVLSVLGMSLVSAAEADLETRVKDWVKAYNTNDLETMTEFYEDSDKVDILVSFGIWHKGTEAYKKSIKLDLAEIEFYDSKAENLTVRDFGEFGVAGFIHKFKFKVLQNGKHIRVHIRTTMSLKKIDGVWKIIQEHSSPIYDIDRHKEIPAPKE